MRAVPQFAVVRREYIPHDWAGVYTSNFRAITERTTMTYEYARALARLRFEEAGGEERDDVSWRVEALTDEARRKMNMARSTWDNLSDDEIPF